MSFGLDKFNILHLKRGKVEEGGSVSLLGGGVIDYLVEGNMSDTSSTSTVQFLMGTDDMSSEDIIDRFSQHSNQYEQAMLGAGYRGPTEIARTIKELFSRNGNDVYILDVAAGTGLCADTLYSHGFFKIDALEPSTRMLDQARKKGIYSRYIVDSLGENALDIANDTYDAVTMAAFSTVILRKLPLSAFEELIRIVKPGKYIIPLSGYIINNAPYNLFPADGDVKAALFRENMKTLESQGKWEHVELRRFPHAVFREGGAISVHRVL
ncbi:methyltransferase-like protein 27 [Haliotis cracherodii]|uniref:methyltransferase-like protein 27 n=1 Tax=Haliotis cracherodii TaxID=6455 RepID=UPI0039EC09CB